MNDPLSKPAPAAPSLGGFRIPLAAWGLGCLTALLLSVASPAQEGIPGTTGTPTHQDVANFSEVARQEALTPTQAGPSRPKPRFRVSPRTRQLPVPPSASPASPPAFSKTTPTLAPIGTASTSSSKRAVKRAQVSPAPAGGAKAQASGVASPFASASFLALADDDRKYLPSTQGAVGPNHLLVALNSQVSVQDRSGNPLSTVTLNGWWGGTFGSSNVSDPRVLFDPYSQRWIFAAVGDREVTLGLLVAVSKSSDPTGDWNRYFYSVGDASGPLYADSPSVAFNTNRITIQVNRFDDSYAFYGSSIYVFNKTNLYAGGPGTNTLFSFIDTGDVTDVGMSQVPAVTIGSALTTVYLVEDWNGNPGDGNGYLRIFSISGPLGTETFNTNSTILVTSANPWDTTSPDDLDFLPQLGITNQIYAGDSHIVNVVYRDAFLWAAQTVFLPSGGATPTHASVQYWQFTPAGTLFQQGRLDDATGATSYAFPSIGVNDDDDVLLGYSRFSAAQYPSANYSFRLGTDPYNTLRADTVLKAGENSYYSPDPSVVDGLNYWGDTSATMVDPSNDGDLWTIQEFAAFPAGRDHWGTWWGRIAPPADLALSMTDSPDPVSVGGTLTYTLVVTNATPGKRVTPASGVKITDTLPAAVNFVSASSSQGACSYAGGVVSCDLGTLPIQGQATVTLVVTTTGLGHLTNTATLVENGQELNPTNNTANTVTTVASTADLAVFVSDSPDPVPVGSNLTYTVLVTNQGPATATGVSLTNILPATVTFLSASSTQGTNTRSGSVITYSLGLLPSGGSVTASIRVSCPIAGPITNRAVVVAATPFEGNPADNTVVTTTKVNSTPTISAVLARSINEDAADSFSFTIADAQTAATNLVVSVTSSNAALIPNSNLVLTGTGGTRTLTLFPLSNQFGSSILTLTVTDADGASAKTTWMETVVAVNDLPTLDALVPVVVLEDPGPVAVGLTGISSGAANEADTLTVTATSSNPAIIPNPVVSYVSPNPTGTLTFTPATNAFGTATITVTVNDNQAVNHLTNQTFTVTIIPVNDPPTINPITDLNIPQGAAEQTVNLSGITSGASNETNALGVTAISSDPTIVPNPTVTYTSPLSTGTLKFTPVASKFGSVVMTVTVTETKQTSNNVVSRTFNVTVSKMNHPPTLNALANVTMSEDGSQTINLSGITTGSTNEFDTLSVTAVSSNLALIPNPVVTYTSPNTNGTLTLTPLPTKFGTAVIAVTVNDNQGISNLFTRTFTLTVSPVNDPPTLDPIGDLTVAEDSGPRIVPLTGITTGSTNEFDTLTVTAVSSNVTVIPNPTVVYTSPGNAGSLQFSPVTNAFGSSRITVTISDNQASNNIIRQTFTVTVAPVNDPPTLNAIANLSIKANSTNQTVSLTGIGRGATNETDTLTITAVSSNPSIVPDPIVNYTSPATNGTLTFAPVPGASGSATITVTVDDGQPTNNSISRTFSVTVNAVNTPPTLDPISPISALKDAGLLTVNLTGITSGATNESQTLSVTASNSNPALLTNFTVVYTSPGTTGSLTFRTVTNATGTAFVTVRVNDGGGSNNFFSQTFTVSIGRLDYRPVITAIADQSTPKNIPITIPFQVWDVENPATSLVVTGQSFNASLVAPSGITFGGSGTNRTVTLRSLTNTYGAAQIQITVTDTNGGFSTSSFQLSVINTNNPPTISTIANQTINEDTSVTVPFSINDAETPPAQLVIVALCTNQTLLPPADLFLGGSGSSRTLTLAPAPNQFGTSTVQVLVTDGDGLTTTNSFLLTVNAVNDPPTLTPLLNLVINENAGLVAVNLSGISSGASNEIQTLTVTAANNNSALLTNLTVNYLSPAPTGSVSFRTVANAVGSATIKVTVKDGASSNNVQSQSFTVTVNAVYQPLLAIRPAGGNVILSWSTNAAGFGLQGRGTLDANNPWSAVSGNVVQNGNQFFLTNPVSGSNWFFRLLK